MNATSVPSARGVSPRGVIRALLASLVGFLGGEYGAGLILRAVARSGDTAALLTWMWLPWILAAVLSGIAVGALAWLPGKARWWYWPAVGSVVPIGAFVVTWVYFASQGVQTPGLLASSLVQVVVSGGLALVLGSWRERAEGVPR